MQPFIPSEQQQNQFNNAYGAPLPQHTEYWQTANGYLIAWLPENGSAAVLPPDLTETAEADYVEGMDDLEELRELIESGRYEAILAEPEHEHSHHT